MQPSDEVLGKVVENAPEGWAVVGVCVVAVFLIIAKLILPPIVQSRERVHMRELDVREKEVAASAAMTETMQGLKQANNAMAREYAQTKAGIEESKTRSREMGVKIDAIDSTTQHTDTLVEDIHKHIFKEGTE